MEELRRIAAGEVDGLGVGAPTSPPSSAPSRPSAPPPPPEDPAQQDAEADPHEVARAIVLRQLTAAPRSRRQLEDKLAQRGCDPEVARVVLDRMEAVGLVDDEAYAHMLVRSQQQGRGLARRGLAHELRRKGIDEEVAQQALADEVTPDGERARAEQLVAKKLRTMSGLDRQVKTRRLAGMLARKGYSGEVAYSVIREALDQDPEHQRD
ncbi:regulatory protein RecX [Kytococcus sp. HMSC28H12]|uniref:regulatory protein RecX n=1 Tax=Kytococcus sp. HMSC28H12 TaxID=1581067 RepID=UPI0009F62DE2|nr:regulatory protein RecX [Kytococcus sp. HMSC28H12]